MFKLLFFQISRPDILAFNQTDLIVGLVFTWVVGVGRYWDDPKANILQQLGLGSLDYIVLLALFIWALLKPFYIKDWSLKNLLTFISLTSAPALLYAIPVERYFSIYVSCHF